MNKPTVLIRGASTGIGAVYADRFAKRGHRRETITIPPLPDADQWKAFDTARKAMLPNLSQNHAAARYRAAA